MTIQRICIIAVLACCFLAGAAAADSAPVFPAQFFGTITTTDGTPIPAGAVLTAELNGERFTFTITEAGKIGNPGMFGEKFLIAPSDMSGVGKTITFYLGGTAAPQTEVFSENLAKELALTFAVSAPLSGSGTGKECFTSAVVVSDSVIPAGFTLTFSDIAAAEQPALPATLKLFRMMDITPSNAPDGTYTVVCRFTLTAADLAQLNVSKEKISFQHFAGGQWVPVTTRISVENADGSVEYDAWIDGFSPFAIAAAAEPVVTTWKEETGYTWNATVVPTKAGQTQTPVPVSTTAAVTATTAVPQASASGTPSATVPLSGTPAASATQSPVPVIGLFAGVSAVLLVRRRT